MFPSPQSALPLPPRPSLERYRKLAKELVKACKAAGEARPESGWGDPFHSWAEAWAAAWIDALVRLSGIAPEPQLPVRVEGRPVDRWIEGVSEFARRRLAGDGAGTRACALADAQFVIARSHGFESWTRFVRCLEALEHGGDSDEARFEAAADAVVAGDLITLRRLLSEEPRLARMRSMREHGGTLLHYAAANGVESYRQRTPENIVEIAGLLVQAGAEVDAVADVYGGSTALELAATSVHAERGGVQEGLLRLLLEHGAKLDGSLVKACLHNGRGKAAEFLTQVLMDRGERLGLVEAAGSGMLALVEELVAAGTETRNADALEQMREGFLLACQFGRDAVVELLIAAGVEVAAQDGRTQTCLHHAVIGGHVETVKLLLKHNPPLEAVNAYGGTPLGQALWSAAHGGDAEVYLAILEALTAAGAMIPERHVPVNAEIDAWLAQHGSVAEPGWHWYGEKAGSGARRNPPE